MADVQAGSAYIAIRPDMSGFHQAVGRAVARGLGPAARRAGEQAGREIVDGVERETAREAPEVGEEIGRGIGAGLERALTRATESISPAVENAMTGIAVAAGAAFSVAMADALDITGAQGKFQAQLGLTAAESQRVGKVAGELYASAYGESMADVNAAVSSVIQNMNGMRTASSESLKETTARAITLAQIMDAEVGEVTRAVSQILRTGLAPSAEEAFDILARGAQLGADKAQDLLDTFNEYGTQFRKFGLDGQASMGLIVQGLQAGARDADIVADAIKEFSIRSIDGSKSTAIGFKAIGLEANDMADRIGKGGDSARDALDLTLDRLRAIKDPLQRDGAAVALFGTQAEDLGAALYALDPSAATKALGQVGGAADNASKAMGETSQAKFEQFKRNIQTTVVDTIVSDVIPALEKWAGIAKNLGVTPGGLAQAGIAIAGLAVAFKVTTAAIAGTKAAIGGVRAVAGGVSTTVGAARDLVGGFRNVNSAFSESASRSTRLGAALRSQGQLMRQQATHARASAAAKFADARASVASAVAAARQRAAAAGAWVMRQATAMRLLAAAKLAEARASTASAIAAARQRAAAIASAVAARVVRVAMLAWTAVQWLLNAAMSANPLALIVIAIVALVAAVVLAYRRFAWFRTIVQAVWGAVWGAIKTAWSFIQPIFNAIKNVLITVVVGAFKAYWAYLKLVWSAVSAIIRVAWNNVIKPIFNVIKWYVVNVVLAYFKLLWSGVKVVWNGIKTAISAAWNNVIKPVFEKLKSGVSAVKSAFQTGVNGIKSIWDRLKGITKAPIKFFVETVYMGGVRKVWSGVRKLVPALPDLPSVKFAGGGIMPGYTPGRDVHRFFSPTGGWLDLSGGEGILRPEFTRALGPRFVHAGNAAARRGGTAGVAKFLGQAGDPGGVVPGFKNGGILGFKNGGILGLLKRPVDLARNAASPFLTKGAEWVARRILEPILTKLNGLSGSGLWAQAMTAIPKRMIDGFLNFIKKVVGPNLGGGGSNKAVQAALSQLGVPYSWGGGGPHGPSRGIGRGANTVGFDCSSLMQYAWYKATGKVMPRTTYTQRPWLRRISKPVPGAIGQPHSGHTFMAVNGREIVEAPYTGGHVQRVPMRGAGFWGLPPWKYDSGGWLQPGVSTVLNATRKPEAVLTNAQLNALAGAAVGGDGGATYVAHFDGLTKGAIENHVRTAFTAMQVQAAQRDRTTRRR